MGYAFSDVICLKCGVRQGGVLSPVLFTVYVNGVIKALSVSVYGCYFHSLFVGCIMYADDLLLLSPPLCDLQLMIDICCGELEKIDMSLNVGKSQVVRIGKLHARKVNSVVINGSPVEFLLT